MGPAIIGRRVGGRWRVFCPRGRGGRSLWGWGRGRLDSFLTLLFWVGGGEKPWGEGGFGVRRGWGEEMNADVWVMQVPPLRRRRLQHE